MDTNPDDINYIINHLFLPPKLPQQDDRTVGRQNALLSHIVESAAEFSRSANRATVDMRIHQCWDILHRMLCSMQSVRSTAQISLEDLRSTVENMEARDILSLHITKQNAGVILRKLDTEITLEFFQASPTAAAVTGNVGKLVIQFPSRPRLSIPNNHLAIKSLCAYLADIDRTAMPDAMPVTMKAGSEQSECRDVPDIRYISELLGGIARVLTSDVDAVASSTVYVTKRVDDHVLWENALNPWRRDPQWLVIRVALQTSLAEWRIDERYGYKAFITYVLARALDKACKANVAHDLLHAMNAKIAARVWKLQSLVHAGFPFDYIVTQNRSCRSLLESQWRDVQAFEARPSTWTTPTSDEIHMAEGFTLTKSREYLSAVFNRSSVLQQESSHFSPDEFEATLSESDPRSRGLSPPAEIPTDSAGPDLWLAVLDVECWIVRDLPEWLSSTVARVRLATLRDLITRHDMIASSLNNPELFSRVFLIVMELWVALDKTVVELIPLIEEYSPELSASSLEPLILPKLSQMRRLRAVERYLDSRHSHARYPQHSLFKFINHPESFAARYFKGDDGLQSLRSRIQSDASRLRNAKVQECTRLNNEYRELQDKSDRLEHRYTDRVDRWGRPRRSHSSTCQKCAICDQAEDLRITVFEWPLPENEVLSRLVVFELHLPEPFGVWRDITYGLARRYSPAALDLSTSPSPTPVLNEYPCLQNFYSPNIPIQRITIASTIKSFLVSHYKECELPCKEDAVIKNHPLHYELYDVTTEEWLPFVFPTFTIRAQCTPTLLCGPYEKLAWTIIGTDHTPNMVIARQSECPPEISYHEWEAFGHLRSGHRLQWRNMMLELVRGTITLGDPAVHLLFWQAACQVEKGCGVSRRQSHNDLAEEAFGREVVTVLRGLLVRICKNWQESWTAATLSVLGCRLFSLTKSSAVRTEVLKFLKSLRETVEKWMDQVLNLLKNRVSQKDSTVKSVTDLRDRVIQLAATCRSTYALDLDAVSYIFKDPESLSTFIKCAIVLQDNIPGNLHSVSTPLRYMLERDVVVSVEVFDILARSICADERGLEHAISSIWPEFHRDPLLVCRHIGNRWIACETAVQDKAHQIRHVYLNLFDGTLLVDGKPLSNLPKNILQHSLFKNLFPNQFTMNIVPSTMKGMTYQLSYKIQNRLEVHFSLTGHDLLIRTREVPSNKISEFVPANKLQGDIPNALLGTTVPIFDEASQSLHFYPSSSSGWNPSASPAWTMRFSGDPLETTAGPPNLMKASPGCTSIAVLSPDSRVLEKLSAVFRPLETSITNLFVTFTPSPASTRDSLEAPPYPHGNLWISLPRYNLTFFISARGDIESKELPGMFISPVQSSGTLFGLKSKLVLDSNDGTAARKIIFPDGHAAVSQSRHHASHPEVTITPSQEAGVRIRTFIYDIDELIGRLIGDGTLTSWYMLAYLHILTSSFLPDPLIHRTGVQQALAMLESSNSFAFMELKAEHIRYLQLIYEVAPVRKYYPPHLTSMETVDWHPVLSPASQSDIFVAAVEAILEHGNNQALFQPNPVRTTFELEGDAALRKRAELRNSRLLSNADFYEREQLCDHPFLPPCCLYESDLESVEREYRVVHMATLVGQWSAYFDIPPDLWEQFRAWHKFSTRVDTDISFDSSTAWLSKSPSEVWFSLFSLCLSASKEKDTYGLMFALGIISYRSDIDLELVRSLLAVATNARSNVSFEEAAGLLPVNQAFNLEPGHTLGLNEIRATAEKHCIQFESSPQAQLADRPGESWVDAASRRSHAYRSVCDEQCQMLATALFQLWPISVPHVPNTTDSSYSMIDMPCFEEQIRRIFSTRFLNRRLFDHSVRLRSAFAIIQKQQVDILTLPVSPKPVIVDIPRPKFVHVTLWGLLRSDYRLAPVSPHPRETAAPEEDPSGYADPNEVVVPSSTRILLSRSSEGNSGKFPSRYKNDLLRCVDALESRRLTSDSDHAYRLISPIALTTIQTVLRPRTVPEEVLSAAGLWPCLGPECLLRQLSLNLRAGVPRGWKKALILYAEGLAATQREKRLAAFKRPGLEAECVKEAENYGGQHWDALTYPDWLLIQLDANLLIRPVQASIAEEMMSPSSQQNTVMQLNMGEGKSSVIVPIISAALADGEQLVRVIVLKPLCVQMFHLLKRRICGLTNRRLFYMPFSRDVPLKADIIYKVFDLFKACARSGGVLLCQPEHILSFQLMGQYSLCDDNHTEEVGPLLEAQNWLDRTARDILDESDEILNVRYQLIYTLGSPQPLQGHSDRWQTVQEIFSLLKGKLADAMSIHPDWLEVELVGPERFPRTRILTQECGRSLLKSIAHQIVFEELMPSTPFRSFSNELRILAFQFLTDLGISQSCSRALEKYSGGYFERLLLLRGLIAHGILLFSLKEKRWRVDYGLDPRRSMLAVPYRAKDCPAPRAEFGHPDVIIVLTCLSYYYRGLSDHQLETTFHALFNTDDPGLRYEDWIKYFADLPENLRSLRGLNLEDVDQKLNDIFPRLRHNKAVIDFYLSECVFPKEAKEFQYKLTTNAWDLAREKTQLTTGFSGTKDHSYLLPLSIRQLDSKDQRHTNAQVLEYLLRAENSTVVHTGSNPTALHLIERVVNQEPHVTVLLDVGAQVLELQNEDVARKWLAQDLSPSVKAAVYCNPTDDEFYVVDRDGRIEPLASSLYRTQLDKTLVYLDEARTRGTDFKFTEGTRAVVTLGPKLSKDKLVQGCMRMRKLGNSHSVLFFASNEIWKKVQMCIGSVNDLTSGDVLIWAMRETCEQMKDNGALWESQGINFDARRTAWEKYNSDLISQSELATVLREKESRTLTELYGINEDDVIFDRTADSERRIAIERKCREFGIASSRNSALLEEQERELALEKQDERQVERVLGAEPLKHAMDRALWPFIRSGITSPSFVSLADCLEGTSHKSALLTTSGVLFQSINLRATKDFSRTICRSPGSAASTMDDFLRSVQWILSSDAQPGLLLLVSPFEANELLPAIRKSKSTHLHLYSPRVSRQSPSLEDLDFFVVPQLLDFAPLMPRVVQELNLFAGQLFFYDKESFKEVCNILGLHLRAIPDALKGRVDAGGFVKDEKARRALGLRGCAVRTSPVTIVRALIGWRRKGRGFTLTHLGQILCGNDLKDSEFNVK